MTIERQDYIAEAITEAFGERCPEFADGCACCEAWEQRDDLLSEIERLREALKPFAGDKLPSSRKVKIAYNRHGLRCAMSDLEIAQDAASRALTSQKDGGE